MKATIGEIEVRAVVAGSVQQPDGSWTFSTLPSRLERELFDRTDRRIPAVVLETPVGNQVLTAEEAKLLGVALDLAAQAAVRLWETRPEAPPRTPKAR